MSLEAEVSVPGVTAPSRVRRFRKSSFQFVTKYPLGAIGLFMVMVMVVIGVFYPAFQRYRPLTMDYHHLLNGPSMTHFFGTDDYGRDQWSRVVVGARIALEVSFAAVAIGSGGGLVLGTISGYIGGIADDILQRVIEVEFAIPGILTAMALMTAFGAGLDKVILAISFGFASSATRTIRGSVLSTKEKTYVDAARSIGASDARIMFRHIIPNIMPVFLIIASGALGGAILLEATLSFLGLGVPPPAPDWGQMLSNSASTYAMSAPWMVIFPGLAITWLVLGFNLFGDALRDIWDPRLRGTR